MSTPSFLTEKEMMELVKIDFEISALRQKKINHIREIAYRKGIAAKKLEDFKSQKMKCFVENPNNSDGPDGVKFAAEADEKEDRPFDPKETAYLCRPMHGNADGGCGWVKGTPSEQEYDDMDFLSGSAGIHYYCNICGELIGEHVRVIS
mgnify:CR=1 FL=1